MKMKFEGRFVDRGNVIALTIPSRTIKRFAKTKKEFLNKYGKDYWLFEIEVSKW